MQESSRGESEGVVKLLTEFLEFQLSGGTSYFPVRKLTNAEWGDDLITKIELTSENPVWDMTSSEFSDQEATNINYIGEFNSCQATERG